MEESFTDKQIEQLQDALRGVFEVSQVRRIAPTVKMPTASGVEFVGFLAQDADSAFPIIRDRFDALGYTAFLFQESQMQVVRAVAGVIRPQPFNPWINLALFLLTVASTVFTGALYEGINPFEDPGGLLRGVPFAFTVMVILGTHEMGHYVVARRHKAAVSLPYFVPLPFISLFGTLGAVIVQRSPFENRKSLFDVGVAGPLAGLIVALPLLIFSLATSEIRPYSVEPGSIFEGNSLLYLGLKYLIHGKLLPYNGLDVYLSSMAFAAWFGLVITFFNLFPIGQLDGGHVLYALIGRRAWPIAVFLSRLLLIAGALGAAGEWSDNQWLAQNFFSGWLLWGILTTLMNPHHPPPLNDISRLDTKRKVLGIVVIILFFLLFTRIPLGTAPILF